MNVALSLSPDDDLDTKMRSIARSVAMGIYELEDILEQHSLTAKEFYRWKNHPHFLEYLRSETEAWKSATNAGERTKVKAAVMMEEWMEHAYKDMKDGKHPLNHRVELGKLIAKIAGLGEPRQMAGGGGGESKAFNLQINIGPGVSDRISIKASVPPAPKTLQAVDNGDLGFAVIDDDYSPTNFFEE